MGKVRLSFVLLILAPAAVACAPVLAGPELPRPAITAMSAPSTTTTTGVSTTTTIDSAEAMAMNCPDEFCLVYRLTQGAVWSDGTPVSGDDFVRTLQAATALPAGEADPGYDLISGIDSIDEDRVRVVFRAPYGPWQGLFSRLIGPEEATNGAFQIVDRVPGDRIVVERADDWWTDVDPVSGAPMGDVDEITFVFMDDPDEMADALVSGDIDVMLARPDPDTMTRLAGSEDVVVSVTPGWVWEHIDFHHEDPLLGRAWVRSAIAHAIDRQDVIDQTARLIQPGATALDNTVYMTRTRPYESHYDIPYDPVLAEQILVDNGCSRDGSDFYTCAGNQMSFVWATTSDDPARRVAFEIISEDLAEIGIELIPDFRTPSNFVASDFLLGGPDRWQLANFAWRAGNEPSETQARYSCGESVFNVNRYCSPEIEGLFREASGTVDQETREDLYNDADRLYLEDVATIPLYQKPALMAWGSELSGPLPNHTSSSDLWNVAAWGGKEAIVVALPAEPVALDPFDTSDDNANRILATMMYGALAMDPSLAPLDVLVESVTVVEG